MTSALLASAAVLAWLVGLLAATYTKKPASVDLRRRGCVASASPMQTTRALALDPWTPQERLVLGMDDTDALIRKIERELAPASPGGDWSTQVTHQRVHDARSWGDCTHPVYSGHSLMAAYTSKRGL